MQTVSASNGGTASAASTRSDPGSSPSTRTETLYGELSRRVLVGARTAEPDGPRHVPAPSD